MKNEKYNTQMKNSNTEQYDVTEQYRTLNTQQTAKRYFSVLEVGRLTFEEWVVVVKA
jgi:hypothetical protein